jgi:antitoxin HicB
MKDLKYYLGLPYTVILRPDADGAVVARIEELPGCATDGPTPHEALQRLEELKQNWIQDALEGRDPIPEPQPEEPLPSGKWVQRVPRSLHRRLSAAAEREGVSLNAFVTSVLSEAVGATTAVQAATALDRACLAQGSWVGSIGMYSTYANWAPDYYWDDAVVTHNNLRRTASPLSFPETLKILGEGLFKKHWTIPFKDTYEEEPESELGKTC